MARTTPITDLITARRQLDEASRLLAKKRQQLRHWSTDMKSYWSDLEKKELELRETFIQFNLSVKENGEKRDRAKQKIERERKIQQRQEEEMKKIRTELSALKIAEESLSEKLQEYGIFQNYLQQVVEKAPHLIDIQGVLNRYETLQWTRDELSQQQADALTTLQQSREQLSKNAEKQVQILMGLHTELANLRVRHNAAKATTNKWDNTLSRLRSFAAEKAVEIEQVQSACWNLYKMICKLRKETENVPEWDTEQQLVQITRRIQELKRVTKMVHEKLANSEPLTNINQVTSTIANL